MSITAAIVADSISAEGIRLTTFQLRYPRFIHAELMTHRDFSRNASSSRAIPVKRMIEDLRRDPAMPVYWGSNKPGMQAGEELSFDEIERCKAHWLANMEKSIQYAEAMVAQGLHKQIANRVLEPWAHINVVVSATNWANFFTLRRHKDAQPEIKVLADKMWEVQQLSTPSQLKPGQWHLPYCTQEDKAPIQWHLDQQDKLEGRTAEAHLDLLKKVSVARCARVSYLTHEGKRTTIEEDLTLYNRLVVSQPLHASPAEHQATPDQQQMDWDQNPDAPLVWAKPKLHGNLHGWIQYRKTLPGEYISG